MIFITGDVHHPSMRASYSRELRQSELDSAGEYAEIIAKNGLCATLFLTGRCAVEDSKTVADLAAWDCIEIGGHTWNAFRFKMLHRLFALCSGSFYGPNWYQTMDAGRTLRTLSAVTGSPCVSWRTHCYRDADTSGAVLAELGITTMSNTVNFNGQPTESPSGVLRLPVNTPTDELNIARPHRALNDLREYLVKGGEEFGYSFYVPKRKAVGSVSETSKRRFLDVDQWCALLKTLIPVQIQKYNFAVIQVHPVILDIVGGFEAFDDLCAWISESGEACFVRDSGRLLMKDDFERDGSRI